MIHIKLLERFSGNKLVGNASVYMLSNLFEKAIPFFILPALIRFLSPEGVGYYTLFPSLLAILLPLVGMSLDSAIILSYFKLDKRDFSSYFSTGMYTLCGLTFLAAISIVIFRNALNAFTGFEFEWLLIVLLVAILQIITSLNKSIWQVLQKPIVYAVFSVTQTLIKNGLSFFLVTLSSLDWKGIVVGHLIVQCLYAIYSFRYFINSGILCFSYDLILLKDLIRVGGPLSLHRIAAWLSDGLGRFVIVSVMGVVASGNFSIGLTFASIVMVTQDAFNRAWVPYLFKQLSHFTLSARDEIRKTIRLYYFIIIIFALVIGLVGYTFIAYIFGAQYVDIRTLVFPLALAAAANGCYKMHVNIIFFAKKTNVILGITVGIAALNIVLINFVVSKLGLLGAAYLMFFIQMTSFILTSMVAKKYYPELQQN